MNYLDYKPQIETLTHKRQSNFEMMDLVLYSFDNKEVHRVKISKSEYDKNKRLYNAYKILSVEYDEKSHKDYDKKFKDNRNTLTEANIMLKNKFIEDLAKYTNVDVNIVNKAIKLLDFSLDEFSGECFDTYINEHYCCPNDITQEEWIFTHKVQILKDYINIIK